MELGRFFYTAQDISKFESWVCWAHDRNFQVWKWMHSLVYKAIGKCLIIWMEMRQQKENHNNNNKSYKQIDICINIYRGKGHSIISSNFILRYQDEIRGGSWCEYSYPCSLVNSRCKKDNAKTIYNTFFTMLDDYLLQIHNGGGISICYHDECPVLEINAQDDTSRTIIPI